MTAGTTDTTVSMAVPRGPLAATAAFRIILGIVLVGGVLSAVAGDWGWIWAWVYVGTLFGMGGINVAVLFVVNPAVIEERMRGGRGRQTKEWDRALVAGLSICAVGTLLVAALDHRFGWTGSPPVLVHLLGVTMIVSGDLVFLAALAANPFFSQMVRVQRERGHRVVSDGPYGIIRHPGYVGWILMVAAPVAALGSLVAVIPAVLAAGFMVARTSREDDMLHQELAGYPEYAARVPWRLLPGVW